MNPNNVSSVQMVAGYRMATAEDYIGRDPVSWVVSGSTDCSTFTALDIKTDYATTTTRNVYLPTFSVVPPPPTYAGKCFKFRPTKLRAPGLPIQLAEFQVWDRAGNRISGATASLAAGASPGLTVSLSPVC
jgi:hypothetical protein